MTKATSTQLKGNKGEWSELYVFLNILANGKLYAADQNLNKVPNVFYSVIKAIREDIHYNIKNRNIIIDDGANILTIPAADFSTFSTQLFNILTSAKGSSFDVHLNQQLENFLKSIKISKLKAPSTTKGDILIKIHDTFTGFEPNLSFSIKSYVGSNPTLLNASGATKITYKLSKNLKPSDIEACNSIEGGEKIKNRINFVNGKMTDIEFSHVSDPTFDFNLKMIDYRMPEILGNLFLESYFVRGKKMKDVVKQYIIKNPNEDPSLIEYKVKDLLVAIALGMVPKTKWTGLDEATGGYIVVKNSGEILCFHIYDRNQLKDYLYNNTKFDTPSSKRTNIGTIVFNERGEQEFNLTVQIRF